MSECLGPKRSSLDLTRQRSVSPGSADTTWTSRRRSVCCVRGNQLLSLREQDGRDWGCVPTCQTAEMLRLPRRCRLQVAAAKRLHSERAGPHALCGGVSRHSWRSFSHAIHSPRAKPSEQEEPFLALPAREKVLLSARAPTRAKDLQRFKSLRACACACAQRPVAVFRLIRDFLHSQFEILHSPNALRVSLLRGGSPWGAPLKAPRTERLFSVASHAIKKVGSQTPKPLAVRRDRSGERTKPAAPFLFRFGESSLSSCAKAAPCLRFRF